MGVGMGQIMAGTMGQAMPYPPGYPPPGYPPPPKPPIAAADLTISVVAMILTVVGTVGAGFMGLMMLAFTDYCPPETCHIDAGVTAIMTGLGIAALIAVVGVGWTIVRLVRRLPAWPFAMGTLGLCAASCLLALWGYIQATGG